MNNPHLSVVHHRRWRRRIPHIAGIGVCGTGLVIWFEEIIAFVTEFIGVIFLILLTSILYIFNILLFKAHEPKLDDPKK
jgi:hypothetical protein